MRRFVTGESSGQVGLDLLLGLAAVLLAELHADTGGALALRALGRHPDHAPGHRQLLILTHQVQQHEHLIAEAVVAVGGDEQASVAHEGHVGQIQGAFVLDREREQSRFWSHWSNLTYTTSERNRLSRTSERFTGVAKATRRARNWSSKSKSRGTFDPGSGRPVCAPSRNSTEYVPAPSARRMRSVSQFSKQVRRSASSVRLQASASCAASARRAVRSAIPAKVSSRICSTARGSSAAASSGALPMTSSTASQGPSPALAASHASAASRSGARMRTRWQRLRIVAGRREGCCATRISTVRDGGS